MSNNYQISNVEQLEAIIGPQIDFLKKKIIDKIDEVMAQFIQRAPLIFLSTIDENGLVDVSPKGDPDGFVIVDSNGDLLIPDRPGNQLAFSFRNVISNGKIGVIFVVPNQRETLRVKGTATLHCDPETLQRMQVNGKPALLYTRIKVSECFFHCGKALIRSKLWQPDSWASTAESYGARQLSALTGKRTEETYEQTRQLLEEAYREGLY